MWHLQLHTFVRLNGSTMLIYTAFIYTYMADKKQAELKAAWAKLTEREKTLIENDVTDKIEMMLLMYLQDLEIEYKSATEDEKKILFPSLQLGIGKYLGYYSHAEARLPTWESLEKIADQHITKMEDQMRKEGWIIQKSADGNRATYHFPDSGDK